jgi:hypothetical protein
MTSIRCCLINSCIYNENFGCTKEEIVISKLGDCLNWVDIQWVEKADKISLRKKYDGKEKDNICLTHASERTPKKEY